MGTISISACTTCGGNCWGCTYADACPQWLDEAPYDTAQIEVPCANLALCESRHEMPGEVEGAIFPNTVDPTDLLALRLQCARGLKSQVTDKDIKFIRVYVTGMTICLVEVINWCLKHKVQCTMMHYDKNTGKYFPQDLRWIS